MYVDLLAQGSLVVIFDVRVEVLALRHLSGVLLLQNSHLLPRVYEFKVRVHRRRCACQNLGRHDLAFSQVLELAVRKAKSDLFYLVLQQRTVFVHLCNDMGLASVDGEVGAFNDHLVFPVFDLFQFCLVHFLNHVVS